MAEETAKKYKDDLLKALNAKHWTQAIHNPIPVELNVITDSEDAKQEIAGLESPFGLILKNEIKFYN